MNAPAVVWLVSLPLVAAPLIYIAGRASRRPAVARWAALVVLAAMWGPFVVAARSLDIPGAITFTLGVVALRLDGVSLLLSGATLTLGTLVVLYSGPYLANESGKDRYYALLLMMIGAIIGLGSAGDLFNLWVWFEVMAVSSYLLVAFYPEQPASLEAGVKYLVQSACGSALVLLGIALVLMQTGALNLAAIRSAGNLSTPPALLAAGGLFVIGFGVKAALVPMHTWLPDAHAQAPSGISAMLSGVVIEAGLVAMLRALSPLMAVSNWGALLIAFGALNMLAGNLLALRQSQVKRLLAYSSVSHLGYMLLGLGVALFSGQADGAQGGLFHLFNHALMKGLAFLAAGALLYSLYLARGARRSLTIADLAGAARRYPLAALALSLAVLGLGGLPPLAGFMSKWQILAAGLETGNLVIGGLVVFAAVNSVLSLGYYAPVVITLYRQQPSAAVQSGRPMPLVMSAPLMVLALAVVAIGIWPGLVSWLTQPASAALLAASGR